MLSGGFQVTKRMRRWRTTDSLRPDGAPLRRYRMMRREGENESVREGGRKGE